MAKNTPEKQKPQGLKEEVSLAFTKPDPPFFKYGRFAALQLSSLERDLFTDMYEAQSGNFIIRGIEDKVSELDFTAFTLAIGQILYNQSYKSGNEDINSGVKRAEAKNLSKQLGETLYYGSIITSLKDLCRLAYGVKEPSTEHKKRIATLIDTIDKKPLEIIYRGKGIRQTRLFAVMNKFTREKDGAILYDIYLNPIFGYQIQKQYGLLPQDITARLEKSCKGNKLRKAPEHYLLIKWLCVQDKRTPRTLTIPEIVKELRMEKYFKKDKGKAEKHLLSICKTMEDIGLLSSHEVTYRETGKGKRIEKITFYLNPNFTRTNKEAVEALGGAEETGDNKDK